MKSTVNDLDNLELSQKEESCIGITQENSVEFQVQSVYLIYTWLMVHATLNLAYPKRYVY